MSHSRPARMEPFDAATMPLTGIRLVEASAGTGKTFSLAGLYVRLIIEKQADIREILVVTFTRAAAQELRERLRERLASAARIALAPAAIDTADPATALTEALIARAPDDRITLAQRLREAATRIDEATITTLHGFAQRAASDNAFDSALPFDRGQQVEDAEILQEAATDYWRSRVYDATPEQASTFLAIWSAPDALYRALRTALHATHVSLAGPTPVEVRQRAAQVAAAWQRDRPALHALLERCVAEQAARRNRALGEILDKQGPEGLLAAIDAGLGGTRDGMPALPAVLTELDTEAGVMRQVKKKPAEWFRPQELEAVVGLARLQVAATGAAASLAVGEIRAMANARKRERRLFSFNDMITAMHDALAEPDHGNALARALRDAWPWILVDEFQDTDPIQYDILRRIQHAPTDKRNGLLLIGDPKQSIYSFRGGDVFAWLSAATDADGRYGMERNFRSTAAILAGIERLFAGAGEAAFVLPEIRFTPVEPGRRPDDRRVLLDDAELPGVTAWHVPANFGTAKGAVQTAIRAATVNRIARLLRHARVTNAEEPDRALKPGDIAVLVNTNREATEMQAALQRVGVPAACIQQDSVFGSSAARDMLRVLRAAASPLDAGRLRAALITPLFGYSLAALNRLDADEEASIDLADRFQQAHVRWLQRGVQAMLEPLIQQAAARVLAEPGGERQATDYLHLADLLQQAEREVFGLHGLARWLEEAMERVNDADAGDVDRLRLADDAELVQITTVHRAKGLQYPVVFVPFAPWIGTGGDRPDEAPLRFHDDDNQAVIDLAPGREDDHAIRAIRERRAEQIRLFYVALTRAEQAVYFTHAAANGAADGPLAWLLHRPDGLDAQTWVGNRKCPQWLTPEQTRGRLEALATDSGGALTVSGLPPAEQPDADTAHAPLTATQTIGPARQDFPTPRPDWSVYSFSRLAGRMNRSSGADVRGIDEIPPAPVRIDPADHEVITHPRGTAFGQALHALLETVDHATWPAPGTTPTDADCRLIAGALRRHGVAVTKDGDTDGSVTRTARLLAATLHSPLPEIGPLAGIPPQRYRQEMEFFLRLDSVPTQAFLDDMVTAGYRGAASSTAFESLRGLMHGFIDLVVEHEGRYWVVDYKTNLLGPFRHDYAPDALGSVMADHHYDLQYLIYLLALHRHLRTRLPDYSPSRHLGGALYLFVRGLDESGTHGIFRDRPDPSLIERLDQRLAGAETPA